MSEFRRAKRRKAIDPVQVTDSMTDEVIGKIGNLSESGMLLQVSRPGIDDALYQFRFNLRGASGQYSVELGAHQLWSEPPTSRGQGWAGFRFVDLSAEDHDAIKAWVEEPGGQYA